MNKRIALLLLVAVILFATMACIGSGEVSGDTAETTSQISSIHATATSAAQEFHLQLTLTAPTNTPVVP